MSLRDLQKGILPNIPTLRRLIPWFNAVSDFVDVPTSSVIPYHASGLVTVGTWGDEGDQRYGFQPVIGHAVMGTYDLTLTTPVDDPNRYILIATLTGAGITIDRVAQISASFSGNNIVRVRMRDIIDTAGTFTIQGADHDFYISAYRLPVLAPPAPPPDY